MVYPAAWWAWSATLTGYACRCYKLCITQMWSVAKKPSSAEASSVFSWTTALRVSAHSETYTISTSFICVHKSCSRDAGDLANALKKRNGAVLPEAVLLDWFVQLCLGLKHVHDRKILHRWVLGKRFSVDNATLNCCPCKMSSKLQSVFFCFVALLSESVAVVPASVLCSHPKCS